MKYRLLAPGPTTIPERVLAFMARPIIHHRTPQFEEVFKQCQDGLLWLLGSSSPPLMLTSSGTGAFEACVENFFRRKDKVLCITGGKFADNWLKICRIFDLDAIPIEVSWGQAVKVAQVEDALKKHPDCKGIVCVASETSTGVRHPYEAIGELCRHRDFLFIVDAVTALGIWDIEPDRDHIDVLIAGSQKGMMLPPGLAFLWASEKAWSMAKHSDLPKFYFDLTKERKAQKNCQTAHTPAVSLIIGLLEALRMMKEEGREEIYLRHKRLALACREAIKAINLKLFADHPSEAITSIHSPESLPPDAIYRGLAELANITIAGGQEHLSGKIFRIGHMGFVDELDLLSVLLALEAVLKKIGFENFKSCASVQAAMPILQDGICRSINSEISPGIFFA